jgi:hypothetical protein
MKTLIVAVLALFAIVLIPSTSLADIQLTFRGPYSAAKSGSTTILTIEGRHTGGDLAQVLRARYATGEAGYTVELLTPTQGCPKLPSFSLSKHSRNVISQWVADTQSAACNAFLNDILQRGLQWRVTDGSAVLVVSVTPAR